MKLTEITPMLSELYGEPNVAYRAFPEEEAPLLNYVVWDIRDSHNFTADNESWIKIARVRISLVTKEIDLNFAATLETELMRKGQAWKASEPEFDNDEKVYITDYEFEVINNA